jgi:hypothetical protein
MGWGMNTDMFRQISLLNTDDSVYEALYDKFEGLTDADLTVDDEVYNALYYSENDVKPPLVFEKRLLSTRFTNGNRKPADLGDASDLFTITSNGDRDCEVIFFPNLEYRKNWYRCGDYMDYAFEECRDMLDPSKKFNSSEPRDFTVFTDFGHYPWTNYLMSTDTGEPIPWENHIQLKKKSNWAPAIPSEIVWYLTTHGILTRDDVNILRPCIAQWWS